MKIRKGDTVKMLYGKDSGRQGAVVVVDSKNGRVVVEGLNIYKKHIKGDGKTKVSEIISITKAVPVSKVMLICPSCNKPTRIGYKIENGKKVRICRKCKKEIEVQKVEEGQADKNKKDKTDKNKKSKSKGSKKK